MVTVYLFIKSKTGEASVVNVMDYHLGDYYMSCGLCQEEHLAAAVPMLCVGIYKPSEEEVNKQGSYVSTVLCAAEVAHCGALVLYLHALYLLSTAPIGHQPPTTCKISTSDMLYFLIYRLMKEKKVSTKLKCIFSQV